MEGLRNSHWLYAMVLSVPCIYFGMTKLNGVRMITKNSKGIPIDFRLQDQENVPFHHPVRKIKLQENVQKRERNVFQKA